MLVIADRGGVGAITAAAGGADRVPQEFATIQDAIDNGTSATIHVGKGNWAGATVTRTVEIIATGKAVIDQGVAITQGVDAGFALTSDADGSQIRGFVFDDVDLGIYSSCGRLGSVASDVVISHNTFINSAQGVNVIESTCGGGDGWLIEHNTFHDIRADISNCGGGLGVFLVNSSGTSVLHNTFKGTLAEPPCGSLFSTAAIFATGGDNIHINQNDIRLGDGGQAFKFDIALFGFQPGGGSSSNVVVANNDLRGSDAPFFGVHVVSFDNFGVSAQCNFGTTLIDHAFGDLASEFFSETNCKRKVIAPSEALSRPFTANVGAD